MIVLNRANQNCFEKPRFLFFPSRCYTECSYATVYCPSVCVWHSVSW